MSGPVAATMPGGGARCTASSSGSPNPTSPAFVARTRGEIEHAWSDWEDGTARFGRVASDLARVPAPRPNWLP